MICETCHGKGAIEERPGPDQPALLVPCPDCGGYGIGHCCDGLAEQDLDGEAAEPGPTAIDRPKKPNGHSDRSNAQ
jgi:hypothetical protein